MSIIHIDTNFMLADPIKGLALEVFYEDTVHMGIMSFDDMLM